MRVKIFDLSWNVDLNRLENEINAFLAALSSNAVKYVQSAASSTRTGDTDQMQTDPALASAELALNHALIESQAFGTRSIPSDQQIEPYLEKVRNKLAKRAELKTG